MRYRIRLIAEAGPDPLTGQQFEGAEEVVEVEADSLEHARQRAPHAMTMRLKGQLLRFYDDVTGEEIRADREPRPFRRATFVIDGLPGTYPGITRDERWNGWAVPYFEKEAALEVAENYERAAREGGGDTAEARARYDEGSDAFRLYDPIYEEEVVYGGISAEVSGEAMTVYPIGTREWTWEESKS